MKYLAAIKNALVLLAVVLLNSISITGHTSAMSSVSHEMGSMKHGSSDATSCATLCRTAVVNKEDNVIQNDDDENDDKLGTAFYSQTQPLQTDGKSAKQRLYAAELKPPPKIPIYILYGVFRA